MHQFVVLTNGKAANRIAVEARFNERWRVYWCSVTWLTVGPVLDRQLSLHIANYGHALGRRWNDAQQRQQQKDDCRYSFHPGRPIAG